MAQQFTRGLVTVIRSDPFSQRCTEAVRRRGLEASARESCPKLSGNLARSDWLLVEALEDELVPGATSAALRQSLNRPDFRSVLQARMERDEQEVLAADA